MATERDIPTQQPQDDGAADSSGGAIASQERGSGDSARPRRLLWRLALPLLFIAAAALGFYSAVGPPWPMAAVESDPPLGPSPLQESPQQPSPPPAAPRDRLPLAPLIPESAAALIEEGKRVADDLVERFPNSPDAHEMLARYHFELGDVERAVEAWRRCLDLDPGYAYAHVGLAGAATQRGAHAEAVSHYRRAVLAEPHVLSHQIELGKALLSAGEIDEALVVLQRVAQVAPTSAEARAELGAAQLQQRDDQAAKASFEAALEHDPAYAPAHFGLATVCARLGLDELAREHEAKFRQFRDERKETLYEQRVTYDDDRALREDMARFYAAMAGVYLAGGRADAAEQLWQRAARLHAQNRESRQGLAWLYLQQGKPAMTIRVLRELAELEPASVLYPAEIARLYGELGRPDDAERTLQTFVGSQPESAAGHAVLAEFYLHVRASPQSAAEHAARAAELSGTAEDWLLLGEVHEAAGDLAAAVQALEKTVDLAPDNLQYRQLLALLKDRAAGQDRAVDAPARE